MVQLVWIICFSVPATTNAIGLTGGPITIIYVRPYLHLLPFLSFHLMCFKGNYTDNYCGACVNGRYGSCGKYYGVCIHRREFTYEYLQAEGTKGRMV